MCICICMHAYKHNLMCICICMHAYKHNLMCICICMHAYKHIWLHAYTYTHTCIQAYMYAYMCTINGVFLRELPSKRDPRSWKVPSFHEGQGKCALEWQHAIFFPWIAALRFRNMAPLKQIAWYLNVRISTYWNVAYEMCAYIPSTYMNASYNHYYMPIILTWIFTCFPKQKGPETWSGGTSSTRTASHVFTARSGLVFESAIPRKAANVLWRWYYGYVCMCVSMCEVVDVSMPVGMPICVCLCVFVYVHI